MNKIVTGIIVWVAVILLGMSSGIVSVNQQAGNRVYEAVLRKQYQLPQVILAEEEQELLEETEVDNSPAEILPVEDNRQEEEDLLIARVVQAEAGGEPLVGKVAVAATILNRMECRNMTVEEVVYEDNQYASPSKGIISNETQEAVRIAREYRDLYPRNMVYFRTDYYHTIGDHYTVVGNHYFSTEPSYSVVEKATDNYNVNASVEGEVE